MVNALSQNQRALNNNLQAKAAADAVNQGLTFEALGAMGKVLEGLMMQVNVFAIRMGMAPYDPTTGRFFDPNNPPQGGGDNGGFPPFQNPFGEGGGPAEGPVMEEPAMENQP